MYNQTKHNITDSMKSFIERLECHGVKCFPADVNDRDRFEFSGCLQTHDNGPFSHIIQLKNISYLFTSDYGIESIYYNEIKI